MRAAVPSYIMRIAVFVVWDWIALTETLGWGDSEMSSSSTYMTGVLFTISTCEACFVEEVA